MKIATRPSKMPCSLEHLHIMQALSVAAATRRYAEACMLTEPMQSFLCTRPGPHRIGIRNHPKSSSASSPSVDEHTPGASDKAHNVSAFNCSRLRDSQDPPGHIPVLTSCIFTHYTTTSPMSAADVRDVLELPGPGEKPDGVRRPPAKKQKTVEKRPGGSSLRSPPPSRHNHLPNFHQLS